MAFAAHGLAHVTIALAADTDTAPAANREPAATSIGAERVGPYVGRQVEPAPLTDSDNVRAGSFLLYPQLQVAELYDDNIFATEILERDDFLTIVSPSLTAESDWLKHQVKFAAGSDIALYANDSSQQTEDYWVDGEGRYDLTSRSSVFGGARHARWHEDRTSPDSFFGEEPTILRQMKAYAGGNHRFDRLSLRVGGTYNEFDFDDLSSRGLIFNMDDRDRTAYTGGVWVGYDLSSDFQVYGEGAFDNRRYDEKTDDFGLQRDSDGYRARFGVRQETPGKFQGDVYVGYMGQDYDDRTLEDVNAVSVGANVSWRFADPSVLSLYVERNVDETTLVGSSADLYTLVSARLEHTIAPGMLGVVHVADSHSDFQGIDRVDDLLDYGIGMRVDVTPHVFVAADYWLLNRRSDAVGADHWRNQLMLTLGARLSGAAGDIWQFGETRDAAHQRPDFDGFYLGAQASYGLLKSKVEGTRGQGSSFGPLQFEAGDDGAGTGGMIGYGRFVGPWYLGLQFDAHSGGPDFDHNRIPVGREIDVKHGHTLSFDGRLGYGMRGALWYALVGGVQTEFETRDTSRGSSFALTEDLTGTRYGFGVQLPASRRIFWQLEQSYTVYEDFTVGRDEFKDTQENEFRLGVGWSFGAQKVAPAATDAISRGPYAGFLAGAADMTAHVSGPREQGSVFQGDFADTGLVAGLFGGYGATLHRLYAGVELEAEAGGAELTQTRTSASGISGTGRSFSVSRKGAYSATVRLGYLLPTGVMLYGRTGYVRADFSTLYRSGALLTTQNDSLDGVRYGLGTEVPLTTRGFLRLEYLYTNFGNFAVNYTSGADRFESTEAATRLAIGFRF